jgi:hypothetical protein
MSTGIDSYKDLDSIDTLHPFQGSEYVLVVVAVLAWIAFHVWQVRTENREFQEALTDIDAEAGTPEAAEPVVAETETKAEAAEEEMAMAAEQSS